MKLGIKIKVSLNLGMHIKKFRVPSEVSQNGYGVMENGKSII